MARQMENANMNESRKPMAGEQNRCYTISDLQQDAGTESCECDRLAENAGISLDSDWRQIPYPQKGFDAWLERQCQ